MLAVTAVLAALAGYYAAAKFAINTDISQLIADDLDWREREVAYEKAFPQRVANILAVIDAKTPEKAADAADRLTERLLKRPELFRSVKQPGGGAFFQRNGLLFLPEPQLTATLEQMAASAPLLSQLAPDPSLRGVMDALSASLQGVQGGQLSLDSLAQPMNSVASAIDDVLQFRPANFSWQALISGEADKRQLRRFVDIHPVLDYTALQPGAAAAAAIRQEAADLKLAQQGVTVRLTGPVAISDEEFGTLQEDAALNGVLTVGSVLLILWLALKSGRVILAVILSLFAGLAVTAALGLMMVGAFNPISVAFFVLFVGIGVDFGLQFSVRYRAERFEVDDIHDALHRTAVKAGPPLALASAATAAGFFSFLPTDYRGLSELGLVAGLGMLVAFVTSITVLPALIQLLNPPAEREPLGFAWLAPADRWLENNRNAVLIGTGATVLVLAPLLFYLRFDFNPVNLRSPKVESISTLLDLREGTEEAGSTIEILAPSMDEANSAAQRAGGLPEVARTMTLAAFVPEDQEKKRAIISKAAASLTPAITPGQTKPAPRDIENIQSIGAAIDTLRRTPAPDGAPGADAAKYLIQALTRLAEADKASRVRAEAALVPPLVTTLAALRQSLAPESVTLETLPAELRDDWMTQDGRARVSISPSGDAGDNAVLVRFAEAVLAIEPNATGEAIGIQQAGETIVSAFIQAGAWALLSITILLWFTLRRISDVLLTLIPLLLAGVVTLELCALFNLPLNFANIIALPVLLGVGVAFKIYYVMAWREGQTGLLQSPLTRAVIYSALTTAVAFGSLWLSNHPGTSSMGQLLALSLICTMAAAVLFQPVLMGPPREVEKAPQPSRPGILAGGAGLAALRASSSGPRKRDRQGRSPQRGAPGRSQG